ncbi:hypothetical protein AAVH_21441 [Aphelenchoides avenae]|nr:hypothetical protein AAVH_21441 [Aphelenchus avenae]
MNAEGAKFERTGTTIQDGTIHIRFSRPRMPTFSPLRERLSKMLQNASATVRPRYVAALFSSFVFLGLMVATFVVSLRTHSMTSCDCSKTLSSPLKSYSKLESETVSDLDSQNATNEGNDAPSCKPAWLLLKRCDYTEHAQGGKCTYVSPTGYEFPSETNELTGNEKAELVAKLKEYARAEGFEFHLEVNGTTEKYYTTADVTAGQELSAYRATVPAHTPQVDQS